MIEVIPVQTLTVIGGLKGTQIIVNLIPVLIHKNGFDAIITKVTDIIYHDNMTSELCLIHMERSSQYINIHSSVEVRSSNKVLLILRSGSPHTCIVHLIVKDGHAIRNSLNFNHGFTSRCSIGNRGDGFNDKSAVIVPLTDKLLHLNELIQRGRLIHRINQPSNETVKTIIRHESFTELFIGDSQRVIKLAINAVEYRGYIGQVTLKQSVLCSSGVIGLRFNNINVNFLNGFTNRQSTLFKSSKRVSCHTIVQDNKADTVDQRINELVSLCFIGENSITNFV